MILYLYPDSFNTVIVEDTGSYSSTKSIKEIVDALCLVYGSTLEGRKEALSLRLQIVQMVPIMISEQSQQMLFPIANGEEGYWWIHYQAILKVCRINEESCVIKFINEQELSLNVNHRSLKRQMHRCELYKKILRVDSLERCMAQLRKSHG